MAGLNDVASELESIARHLRRAGDTELVQKLTRAFRDGVRPVPGEIRANLIPALPDPYAETLATDVRIGTNVRTTGGNPGVSVTAVNTVKARKLRYLDEGRLSHPLYGDREHWYTQPVRPGWFTGPCEAADPRVTAELEKALKEIANEAAGRGSL